MHIIQVVAQKRRSQVPTFAFHFSRMNTPAADICKREIIRDTLIQLKQSMPDDNSRAVCRRFLERLDYTAPELLDNRWREIHEFLSTQLTQEENLIVIWNRAVQFYNKT